MGDGSVTIVIPVKNGLPHFEAVCTALKRQDYDAPWSVLVIDSGSTDGSLDLARGHGFDVLEIDPSTFGHGRTRNLGARTADSEFVAFLTHDAIPNGPGWLAQLVAPLRADPRVAGAFSRHIAHTGADPFTAWELETHFKGLEAYPVVEITDRAAYDADQGLRQVYHYYSDNASVLRKSVWQDIPYPDVQFAEDQIWAQKIVEAGYRKAYASTSVVRHSHAFGPFETLQRSFDESRAFNRLFGYELSPNLGRTLRSALFLMGRDARLAFGRGWWRSHPGKTLSRMAEAVARPFGHYLGCRPRLPAWLERNLSRDDWIRGLGTKSHTAQAAGGGPMRKVIRHYKAHGTRATARAIGRRLLNGPPAPQGAPGSSPVPGGTLENKTDVIGFYRDILGHEHGDAAALAAANPDSKTLQWVVPNFGFGSGGHLNIFRFINNLAQQGYKQRLVILPPYDWSSPEQAKEAIGKWYQGIDAEVALGVEGFAPAHATIATGWQTAYWVAKYAATRDRFYFVQDFEPAFYATSSEFYFAENTYRLGLKGITAGDWLAGKLADEYGMKTGAVSFGCDTDFYTQQPRRDPTNFNILFYSRHVTRRRLFEMGLMALEKVCEARPECAVIFAGGDVSGFKIPFHHLNAGELTLGELPDLYSQCDLSLVLSGTNLSLLPYELAACKCPIVMNDTPSARWLLPDSAAYYAPLDPDAMARTIIEAVDDAEGRTARAEEAYRLAQASSWTDEATKMAHLLETL